MTFSISKKIGINTEERWGMKISFILCSHVGMEGNPSEKRSNVDVRE